jgi:hypothetical protein
LKKEEIFIPVFRQRFPPNMKLFLTLLFLVGAANAISLDALKRMLRDQLQQEEKKDAKSITFKEYLRDLPEPHPIVRAINPGTICDASKCGTIARLPTETDECQSTRWKPDYVKHADGCECLQAYKCCAKTCPVADVEECKLSGQKGYQYGRLEEDCCGCEVTRCYACPPPEPEETRCPGGEGARPTQCYTYTQEDHYAPDADQCWESGCVENASDALNDTCQASCEQKFIGLTTCLFPEERCRAAKVENQCANRLMQTAADQLVASGELMKCYDAPESSVDDTAEGFYHESLTDTCDKCQKWVYTKKSCAAKNSAAAAKVCHLGEDVMDRWCLEKKINKDDCDCDKAICEQTTQVEGDVFTPGLECPVGHEKRSGVSICMKARDICLPLPVCTAPIPMDPTDCPRGTIQNVNNAEGCPESKCVLPTLPDGVCECRTYTLSAANQLQCSC